MVEENPEGKELSYDLRQYQAKIIGEQILRVGEAQDQEPYIYFNELEKLYIAIHHKLKDISKDESAYETYYNSITKMSNDYRDAWSGNKNNLKYNEIRKGLQKLHIWLMMKIEAANLFGTKYTDDEDEL